MKVEHRSMIHGRCPHGPWDYYEVIVEPREFLTVEDLQATLDDVRGQVVYQESLAKTLAGRLNARVTLRGRHGAVDTEVVVE